MRKVIPALLSCLLVLGCQRSKHHVVRGFYYWRTNYGLSAYEQQRLAAVHCQDIYLRCFDVVWDAKAEAPRPAGIVRFAAPPDHRFNYTPVVFITQQVMANIRTPQLPALAASIHQLLSQLLDNNGQHPKMIQIDCDWTGSTRERYFELLRLLHAEPLFRGKTLSCTIRLHQIKFMASSGIPPADRGLLMCYNLGDLKRPGARNSILDAGLAETYLQRLKDYPLALDIALPLFQWCLQFREGKLRGILRDVAPEEIGNTSCFQLLRKNLYRCEKDTTWRGYDFRSGDELRLEAPSVSDIAAVAGFTARQLKNDSLTVLFFHADSVTLRPYENHELEAIYHSYN